MPYAGRKLQCSAEEIDRSAAIFVDERNEEETSNGKASPNNSGAGIEDVDRKPELCHYGPPCCEANIELNKGPQHEKADEGVIKDLPRGGPIKGVIGIGGGRRKQN